MLRRVPLKLTRADGVPVTRLFFAVDECTADELAGPDSGRASSVTELRYTSPGRGGQAWQAPGSISATYGRLEASLDSDAGPWTTISAGGALPDPAAAGEAGTLWVRFVSHRWETAANPDAYFTLGLFYDGAAGVDDD